MVFTKRSLGRVRCMQTFPLLDEVERLFLRRPRLAKKGIAKNNRGTLRDSGSLSKDRKDTSFGK